MRDVAFRSHDVGHFQSGLKHTNSSINCFHVTLVLYFDLTVITVRKNIVLIFLLSSEFVLETLEKSLFRVILESSTAATPLSSLTCAHSF